MNAGERATRLGDIYAGSLFELAEESKSVETVMEDLASLGEVLTGNPEFASLIGSPWFTREYKAQLLERLFSAKIADLTLDFLMVAAKHDRLMFLPQMIARYTELFEAKQGLQRVRLILARTMASAEAEKLSAAIADILQSKVKCEIVVDPSIMGGLVLRYGDKVIDNSVRGRLNRAITAIMKRQDMQG